jgi:hypothetical protein
MDPTLLEGILGPYGVVIVLAVAVVHLYRENTALRQDAMDLLKKYQERDEEERKLRLQEEQRRKEADRSSSVSSTR